MQASIVDLRYRMKEVLEALRRKEIVHILYHGKEAGVLVPARKKNIKKVEDHPFYGSSKKPANVKTIEKEMDRLRGQRYRAF